MDGRNFSASPFAAVLSLLMHIGAAESLLAVLLPYLSYCCCCHRLVLLLLVPVSIPLRLLLPFLVRGTGLPACAVYGTHGLLERGCRIGCGLVVCNPKTCLNSCLLKEPSIPNLGPCTLIQNETYRELYKSSSSRFVRLYQVMYKDHKT